MVFKVGERVIAISKNPKNPHEEMQVVKSGSKFITCIAILGEALIGREVKFSKDNLIREDWSSYELYHSVEEYQYEKRRLLKIENFKRELCNYSEEEIELFREIHNKGI